jgi:predicted RNA-binding Zn-ribbon protein involved in translation (DUF1610 family)
VEKFKPAVIICSGGDKVIFECPHCGSTLLRSNLEKTKILLNSTGTTRGKICPKCGATAVFELDARTRRRIEARECRIQS